MEEGKEDERDVPMLLFPRHATYLAPSSELNILSPQVARVGIEYVLT